MEVITGYPIASGTKKKHRKYHKQPISLLRNDLWRHYLKIFWFADDNNNNYNNNNHSNDNSHSNNRNGNIPYDPKNDPDNNNYEYYHPPDHTNSTIRNEGKNNRLPKEKALAKASAWYYVTYHPSERDKRKKSSPVFLSFAWIVMDQLILIKESKRRRNHQLP